MPTVWHFLKLLMKRNQEMLEELVVEVEKLGE